MDFEINAEKAPVTAQNFLDYINAGHYDGTIFHRVIENFVIQGGGHTADMTEKSTREAIVNEANNGLSNKRGTIAMAREMAPNTATSQFYINHKDNPRLDFVSENDGRSWGYAVFGRILAGEDVLDAIAKVKTHDLDAEFKDVPVEPVVVESIRVIHCPN
ncbi:peptidylprolyl isomerase [Porticoccaceae bacterium LTM1]|nr:peptidylprolyl isomerase [Porticoccaceae bacterium LTM1]